jgi:hypothetical protein
MSFEFYAIGHDVAVKELRTPMEAAERTISQILTEQIRYEIPPYQRPYSWDKGNVEQLLDDVWEAYEANDEEYFIGSLITIEREKGRLYDVVDGQQRLTTLNLIFCRLRDAVDEPAKSELGRRVLPRNALTGAYSGVIRPVIPKVSGHPFRFYPAIDSGASGHPVM